MAKSFFERITGSARVTPEEGLVDGESSEIEADDISEASPTRLVKGRRPSFKAVIAGVKDALVPAQEKTDVTVVKEDNEKSSVSAGVPPAAAFSENVERAGDDGEDDDYDGELTVDIYDDGSHFVAQSTIAGVRPEDIEISVVDNNLTIRGMRKRPHDVSEERFYAKELYWGRFSRTVSLPEDVDDERTEALLKNGLLTVRIPKKSRENTKKVKIKSE